jgi:hypothetical protein
VDTENRQAHAAIRLSLPAGHATATGKIGINCANIAWFEQSFLGGCYDLHSEFMPHDARILEKGMLALKDVVISAANANPTRPDQSLPGAESRFGPLLQMEVAGASADKRFGEVQGTL